MYYGNGWRYIGKRQEKIADFVNEYVKSNGYDVVMKNKELLELYEENDIKPESVFYLNSDYCYNKTNKGMIDNFKNDVHMFEYVKRGYYRLLGENYKYNGEIVHKGKCDKEAHTVGRWENGIIVEWNPQ